MPGLGVPIRTGSVRCFGVRVCGLPSGLGVCRCS